MSGEAKPLTAGPVDFGPVASTDGREIYFNARANGVTLTFRVPVNGGTPAAVKGAQPFWVSDILSDGRLLGGTAVPQDDDCLKKAQSQYCRR